MWTPSHCLECSLHIQLEFTVYNFYLHIQVAGEHSSSSPQQMISSHLSQAAQYTSSIQLTALAIGFRVCDTLKLSAWSEGEAKRAWWMLSLTSQHEKHKALSSKSQHSISYTLSRSHSVIVEYTDESTTDMFQERAANWQTVDGLMDGLTTNGVPVGCHSAGDFVSDPDPGVWREISVCGNVYTLRETRSAQQSGSLIEKESNLLQDGSLIDLCGVTLLWRTTSGLHSTPSLKPLEVLRQELNAARPQCPVGLSTLAFPTLAQRHTVDKKQPWVYMHCGHVHGYHSWGSRSARPGAAGTAPAVSRLYECPLCPRVGPYMPLWLGCKGGLYLDAGPPSHAFCPCGHVCSEKTAWGWSQIPLPHGTHALHTACPFCGSWLTGKQAYVRLIFHGGGGGELGEYVLRGEDGEEEEVGERGTGE